MTRPTTAAIGGMALLTLAACGSIPGFGGADDDSGASGNVPSVAEQSCLIAVSSETGTSDVTLLASSFSEIGTTVRAGVGPDQTPWQCISYNDGRTGAIRPL